MTSRIFIALALGFLLITGFVACDSGSNLSENYDNGNVLPLATPSGFTVTSISSSQIDLSWTASTVDSGVPVYAIYRDGLQIATTANNSYSDVELMPNTEYCYCISVSDTAGNKSPQTNELCVSTLVATFIKTFGGELRDHGFCVQETSDGGYILTGQTKLDGNEYSDVYLIKTDSNGNEVWSQTFGGLSQEESYSVRETSDGGYIIAGITYSYGAGANDIYLIKTDSGGNEVWSQTFGGPLMDYARSVLETPDGGYIVAGFTGIFIQGKPSMLDVLLIKTDSNGNEVWSQTFGSTGSTDDDRSWTVKKTSDGGYIIVGHTFKGHENGYYDVLLIKTDSNGNEVWSQTYGGSGLDRGYDVEQTSDGGYVIGGYTTSYGAGESDFYLIKTDSNGNEVWSRTFGGSSSDNAFSMEITSDGGYILVGKTDSYGAGGDDVYLVKTDPDGNEVWSRTFGGTLDDNALFVIETSDGGFIMTGYTEVKDVEDDDDIYLIKTDSDGYVY